MLQCLERGVDIAAGRRRANGTFGSGGAAGGIALVRSRTNLGVYERYDGTRRWLLILRDGAAAVTVADGWKIVNDSRFAAGGLVTVARSTG